MLECWPLGGPFVRKLWCRGLREGFGPGLDGAFATARSESGIVVEASTSCERATRSVIGGRTEARAAGPAVDRYRLQEERGQIARRRRRRPAPRSGDGDTTRRLPHTRRPRSLELSHLICREVIRGSPLSRRVALTRLHVG